MTAITARKHPASASASLRPPAGRHVRVLPVPSPSPALAGWNDRISCMVAGRG